MTDYAVGDVVVITQRGVFQGYRAKVTSVHERTSDVAQRLAKWGKPVTVVPSERVVRVLVRRALDDVTIERDLRLDEVRPLSVVERIADLDVPP